MAELCVGLGERSYPIYIEPGCLGKVAAGLKKSKVGKRYAVISDSNVAKLYGGRLLEELAAAGLTAKMFVFAAGEENKTMATVTELASSLAQAGYDRHDAIIALGGGVTGDIAGFLASAYMRGIPFVQIPTTLLSQVDSSVGGKTGVDLPEGKNLVGAFYQPKAVYIDTDVLRTLDDQELLGGLAEVIKYGVIRDEHFFSFMETERKRILSLDPEVIVEMITRCCAIKAEVVAEDEREGGLRKILNYGHTIGHAVEGASNYQLIHGLAVSIGMVAAARLSVLMGSLEESARDRLTNTLLSYGMPTEIPGDMDRDLIKRYLKTDKKAVSGKVQFVLPQKIGATCITDEVSEEMIDQVIS